MNPPPVTHTHPSQAVSGTSELIMVSRPAGGRQCHRPEHSSHMSHVSCSSRADACLRDIVYSVNYLCQQTEERDTIVAE